MIYPSKYQITSASVFGNPVSKPVSTDEVLAKKANIDIVPTPSVDQDRLFQFREQLAAVREQAKSLDELVVATSKELQSIWTAVAIWSVGMTNDQGDGDQSQLETDNGNAAARRQLGLVPRCLLDPLGDTAAWNSTRDQVESLILANQTSRQPIIEYQPQHFLVLIPFKAGAETDWLGGIFQETGKNSVSAESMLVSDHLNLAIQNFKVELISRQAKSLSEVIGLGEAMANSPSIEASCMTLTNRMRLISESLQVALVMKSEKRKDFRLVAISDVESFDADSETTRKILKAATQATTAEAVQVWQSGETEETLDRLALKNFGQIHSCDGVINIALHDQQKRPFAALLFAVSKRQASDQAYIAFLQSVCDRLASQLLLVRQAQRKPTQLLGDWLVAQRQRKWFRIGSIAFAIALLSMLIPMPYKISCDCETQPVIRRFIAAPYEGMLEESLVHNGDMVKAGQVLARMEGRRLRMKLSGLEAEYKGQKKVRDSALARGSVAESQIAANQIVRLNSEINLVQSHLGNLEIRSPLDGMIISGDLDKAQGAPLEIGQELFEVAPLQKMLIELAIPENEIKFVRSEMPVSVRLNAFPFQVFRGKLLRIHARAEIVDDANVFLAEVELPNESLRLKPGMKGAAIVCSDWRPLGWNLFHHSWDSLRRWTVW